MMITRHQAIKFRAEQLAMLADPEAFMTIYLARGTAYGTAVYEAARLVYDAYMAPFISQAADEVDVAIDNYKKQEALVEQVDFSDEALAAAFGLDEQDDTEK